MKTFNELVKGDKIYRLQYQSYMDYNNNIIPYVETVDEFTIASSNNEIIGKENYRELTFNGKLHAYKQLHAVLKKGTKVTVQEIIKDESDIWLKIPSRFYCRIL